MNVIYSLLEKGFIKYLLTKNGNKITKDNLTFKFFDLDGNAYYEFPKDTALPIDRVAEMKKLVMWLSSGMEGKELDELLEAMDKALTEGIKQGKGGAAKVGYMIHEMRERKKMVIHDELFYRFIAIHFVRGDESPNEYSPKIQAEKVEAFKKLNKLDDAFFLNIQQYLSVLSLSNITHEELLRLLNDSIIRREAVRKMVLGLESE